MARSPKKPTIKQIKAWFYSEYVDMADVDEDMPCAFKNAKEAIESEYVGTIPEDFVDKVAAEIESKSSKQGWFYDPPMDYEKGPNSIMDDLNEKLDNIKVLLSYVSYAPEGLHKLEIMAYFVLSISAMEIFLLELCKKHLKNHMFRKKVISCLSKDKKNKKYSLNRLNEMKFTAIYELVAEEVFGLTPRLIEVIELLEKILKRHVSVDLQPFIDKRNNIVHRYGRDKKGITVLVRKNDVIACINMVRNVCQELYSRLQEKYPPEHWWL